MLKNSIVLSFLIAVALTMTSCGDSDETGDSSSQQNRVTLKSKGNLGAETYKLFQDASNNEPGKTKDLNSLLQKTMQIRAKNFATKAERDAEIDTKIGKTSVAGVDKKQLKMAMQLDHPLPDAGLSAAGGLGPRTYGLFETAFRKNAALKNALNTILGKITPIYSARHTTKNARDAAINGLHLATVGGITPAAINTHMQIDKPLLEDQGGLGARTYALFTAAAAVPANAPHIAALNTLLPRVTTVFTTGHASNAARDTVIDGLGIPTAGVAGITAAHLKDQMLLDQNLDVAPVFNRALLLVNATQTNLLFTNAAVAANSAHFAAMNELLTRLVDVYTPRAPYDDKAARDTAFDTAIAVLPAVALPVAAITADQIKNAMQQDRPLLEAQGALGTNAYNLFLAAARNPTNTADARRMRNLNALLTRATTIFNTRFPNNAGRNTAIDGMPFATAGVAGITAADLKTGMLGDRDLDVAPGFNARLLLPGATQTNLLFTDAAAIATNAPHFNDMNTLLTRLASVYTPRVPYRNKAARDAAFDTAIAARPALVLPLATTISADRIKGAMQQDRPLLETQGALGARTYRLFTDAAVKPANAARIPDLNALLADITAIFTGGHANNAARDAAVDRLPIPATGVAGITAARLKDEMLLDQDLDEAFNATLLLTGATRTNLLFTSAARTPGNKPRIAGMNELLRRLAPVYAAGHADRAARDTAVDAAFAALPALALPATITAVEIKDRMQEDKPLLKDLTGLGAATAALFTGVPAGIDKPTMVRLNQLLDRVKPVAAAVHADKNARDTVVNGLGIPAAGIAGIRANTIIAALQTDNELIVSLAESGLVHQAIYDAVKNNAGSRTPAQVNRIMQAVQQAIAANRVPGNPRNNAILTATRIGAADEPAAQAYALQIIGAVDPIHHTPFDNTVLLGAAATDQLFTDAAAIATNGPLFANMNQLLGLLAPIYAAVHVDKAARDALIDSLPIPATGVAGITAGQIKDAMQQDKPLLKDRTGLGAATATLFENNIAGIDAATMVNVNLLLDAVIAVVARDAAHASADKAARDAAVDGIAELAAVTPTIAALNANAVKTAMQTDNELIISQAESGLAQGIYTAITKVDTRGTRTPRQINDIIRYVHQQINNHPQPGTNRNDAIEHAATVTNNNVADKTYGDSIIDAVDRAHPALKLLPAYYPAPNNRLLKYFQLAFRNSPSEANALNDLMDGLQSLVLIRDGTEWKARPYHSKAERNIAIDGLAGLENGNNIAGITARHIKDRWAQDYQAEVVAGREPALPNVTPQANSQLVAVIYNAIINATKTDGQPITIEQKEKLLEPILTVSQIRPRIVIAGRTDANYTTSRNHQTDLAVTAALGALDTNVADAINAALEIAQPAGGAHALPPRDPVMPESVYKAITEYMLPFPNNAFPRNLDMSAMLKFVTKEIYNKRPQPGKINDTMNSLVKKYTLKDGSELDWVWTQPWVDHIKTSLVDPASNLVDLIDNPGVDKALYEYVAGDPDDVPNKPGLNLTNIQKNALLTKLASATSPVASADKRLAIVVSALRDAPVKITDDNVIRDTLKVFVDKHPIHTITYHNARVVSVENGVVKVTKSTDDSGKALNDPTKYSLPVNLQQKIPLKVGDLLKIDERWEGIPFVGYKIAGNGILDWQPKR